jgi:hypothetical protein
MAGRMLEPNSEFKMKIRAVPEVCEVKISHKVQIITTYHMTGWLVMGK